MRGLFQILMAEPDGLPARVALERLEERFPATEFEGSTYPGRENSRRYPKIVRFATLGPVKAGWMIKDRGQWSITEDGRKAYKQLTEPGAFVQEADRLYRQWRRAQPDMPTSESEAELEDDNATVATALEEAEEAAWTEIEERLSTMSPYDLQELVAGLLRGMGYHVFWVAPPGPDKGIDVVAFSDPLGVKGPRLKVQVKRQVEKVAAPGLRSFLALLNEGDAGLFVCTGGFTKDADNEARNQEKRRLMLVDAKKLFDLWVEHYPRIPEQQRSLLPIKPVYYLVPAA